MKSLNEDINKQEFKQIYLLYGEEVYLRKLYKNKMQNAMADPDDSMNVSYYEGTKLNIKEIIDIAETLPFFADRRLIIIENSGLFKGKADELADYMKELPESTAFIFAESEVDKRSRLYKVIKDKGRVVDFPLQDEGTLVKWILGLLKKENKNITQATMRLFLSKTGSEMGNIEKEIEKLISYTLGRDVITDQDVEDICTVRITNKIFDMINAIAQKKQKRALQLYYDLLALKEPPMRILFLITRQFNLLLQAKDLVRLGFDKNAIGKQLGLQGFVAGNYITQARSFTLERLHEAVKDCIDTEEAVKTGRIGDLLSVELLIVKYSA